MTTATTIRRPRTPPAEQIDLPDGDRLQPRKKFAAEVIKTSDRTARRMNFPTVYLNGVAYIKVRPALQMLADAAVRKNQPVKRRRT